MKTGITFAKRAVALLLLCSLLTLSACSTTKIDETKKFKSDSSTENIEVSSASNAPEVSQESPTLSEPIHESGEVAALHLNKTTFAEYDFPEQEGGVMLQIGDAYLELEGGDAERYPALADALAEEASSVKANVRTNITYLADRFSSQDEDSGGDMGWIIEMTDIRVCRADSIALSVLGVYDREEFGESSQYCYGRTLDTQTGETLYLSDVIRDMDALPSLVEQILVDYVFGGEFYSETAVEDYFADRLEDSYNWTLEYNGVSIHFNPGDIADPEYGAMSATILFAEHPELFEERYMAVPEAYSVELPDVGYYIDVNGDGAYELLQMWREEGEMIGDYSGFGIGLYPLVDTVESVFAYEYYPYYVKTADGGHFLYVFYQDSYELDWKMQLLVYDLSDGGITKAGECNVRPYYQPKIGDTEISDCFSVPTDPETLYLDDFDDPTRTYTTRTENGEFQYDLKPPVVFAAGSDGVPERK